MSEFGKRLVELRHSYGASNSKMSQEELARRIEVDQSVISRYESGKIVPPAWRILRMCEAMNKRSELDGLIELLAVDCADTD